jgi:hypothetical protein
LTYNGIAERTSLNSTTRTNLHIIFYNHDTNLRYLVMHALMAGIAESILADCRISIYNHTIAYPATIVNDHIGIDYAVIADLRAFAYMYTGINYTAVSDPRLIGYGYKIMNMTVGANLRTVRN